MSSEDDPRPYDRSTMTPGRARSVTVAALAVLVGATLSTLAREAAADGDAGAPAAGDKAPAGKPDTPAGEATPAGAKPPGTKPPGDEPAGKETDEKSSPEKPAGEKGSEKADKTDKDGKDGTGEKAPGAESKNAPHEKASDKRPLPDYDGRGEKSRTVGQDLLWVPRILVSPIYFTTEYVIRKPLGALVSAAERSHVPEALYDFFFFGPNHKAGVVPTLYLDFGFSPSVGLFGFWNDAGFKGNDLSAHFSIWTSDWIAGSVAERFRFNPNRSFTIKAAAIRRPDRTFFGEGPASLEDNRSRYGETRLEGSGTFDVALTRSSQFSAGSGVRSVNLYHGDYDGDPSVEVEAATGAFALPAGFGVGYTDVFNHALLAYDSRRAGEGSGVRLEAQAEQGSDVRSSPGSGWIRYQGTAGVFWDVNGHDRVLSLSGTALFAEPLEKGGQIPFTELVTLGGNQPILSALATGTGLMPGFYTGRLVDRSAAVATLHYRWPIWAWLSGSLQAAVGNVFGDQLQEFKPGNFRFSGALGVESSQLTENSLQLLVGIGSETIDHGGQVDSIRLAIGTSRF